MVSFSKILKIGALSGALGLAFAAAPAIAVPRDHELVWFFSDDTYTEKVGSVLHSCSGMVYRDGIETPYSQVMISAPCTPIGPWP
jgi:hypothetical protein